VEEGEDDDDTCPLLDLLQTDLFPKEVLERLNPMARTMLAQVGRPWLAAVRASGLPRLPSGVPVRLQLAEYCTSPERLAWAKANGCPWGGKHLYVTFFRDGLNDSNVNTTKSDSEVWSTSDLEAFMVRRCRLTPG